MKNIILAGWVSGLLVACGGGSGEPGPTANYSAPVGQALGNIVQTLPDAAKAFTGAFASVNGQAVGYVSGISESDVALKLAQGIANAPTSNADAYKALLSDAGLSIVIVGADTGQKSSITGLPLKYPDSVFVGKLGRESTAGGAGGVVTIKKV
jgi:hypothetical protein